MKTHKKFIYLLVISFIGLSIYSCGSSKKNIDDNLSDSEISNDTVRIANDSLEYEVIIIEPGFDVWLKSVARPRNYFTQNYLEIKNRPMIITYNERANDPIRYGDLYPQPINYDFNVDYGYEVNYLIYNYLLYFQERYNQKL